MKIIIEEEKDLQKNTEKRKERMFQDFKQEPVLKVFKNIHNYNQIIAQVGIPFSALCEHHEVCFEGECSIAYIPGKYLLGLSKLGRIVEYFLNPTVRTIQEKATYQILKAIKQIKPAGAMVIIKAKHSCICYRGVKKPSLTITSAVYGVFKRSAPRQEFLNLMSSKL